MELQLPRDQLRGSSPRVIRVLKILREVHRKQPVRQIRVLVMIPQEQPAKALLPYPKLRGVAVSVSLHLIPSETKTVVVEYWQTSNDERDIQPRAIVKIISVSRIQDPCAGPISNHFHSANERSNVMK